MVTHFQQIQCICIASCNTVSQFPVLTVNPYRSKAVFPLGISLRILMLPQSLNTASLYSKANKTCPQKAAEKLTKKFISLPKLFPHLYQDDTQSFTYLSEKKSHQASGNANVESLPQCQVGLRFIAVHSKGYCKTTGWKREAWPQGTFLHTWDCNYIGNQFTHIPQAAINHPLNYLHGKSLLSFQVPVT